MLSKKRKVKREIFRDVLLRGKSFHSALFTLRIFFDKKNSAALTRFSFVVSQKIARKATVRNELKRRGYAIIRKNISKIKLGYVCVFFLKKHFIESSIDGLEKEIIMVLKYAGVLV